MLFSHRLSIWIVSCNISLLDCRYQNKKHLVDVTEIFNQLNMEKKIRLIKTVYLIVLLFMSMFWYALKKNSIESIDKF